MAATLSWPKVATLLRHTNACREVVQDGGEMAEPIGRPGRKFHPFLHATFAQDCQTATLISGRRHLSRRLDLFVDWAAIGYDFQSCRLGARKELRCMGFLSCAIFGAKAQHKRW